MSQLEKETKPIYLSFFALVFLFGMILLCLFNLKPPKALPTSINVKDFSAQRAALHLEKIANETHPIGTKAHQKVKNYLLTELKKLGLQPLLQKTEIALEDSLPGRIRVENIIAKLPGTSSSQGLLFMAHYDSVPHSFGANDDGAGVITLLETLRALKSGPPLKNDLIFLFTDAEEVDLYGAKAFAEQHPLAKEIGIVFNFEARGGSGIVNMFETSHENGWLIQEFAKAAPYPFATSLSYEVYNRMPNDTDFTIFKKHGVAGLNFAYIDNLPVYHTTNDNSQNIDLNSVQHHGSYALNLAKHFGNLSISQTKSQNLIFFNVLFVGFFYYSETLALPLMLLGILLFGGIWYGGFKRKNLRITGTILGIVFFLVSIAAAPLITHFLFKALRTLFPENGKWHFFYHSKLFLLVFLFFNTALFSLLISFFKKKVLIEEMTFGALFFWLILSIATSVLIPGVSFVFIWPLIFSLLGNATYILKPNSTKISWQNIILISLGIIPALLIWIPLIYLLFIALGLKLVEGVLLAFILTLGLTIPHLSLILSSKKWAFPAALFFLSLLSFAYFTINATFNKKHPLPNHLIYFYEANTKKAEWQSYDSSLDSWTSQFFPASISSSNSIFQGPAPLIQLTEPQIVVQEDFQRHQNRKLTLTVTLPPYVSLLDIKVSPATTTLTVSQKNQKLKSKIPQKTGPNFRYLAPPQTFQLTINAKIKKPIQLKITTSSFAFPNLKKLSLPERPEEMRPSRFSDMIYISKTFSY